MQMGRVVGNAVATLKHPALAGCRLLVVQPLSADGQTPDGDPQLVADRLGAALGEMVILTTDGRQVRRLYGNRAPMRYTVLGIPDAP